MGNETVYRCPSCDADLLRVGEPDISSSNWPRPTDSAPDSYFATVRAALSDHYQMIDAGLCIAMRDHQCAHPLRWRLWLWRHRADIEKGCAAVAE